MEIVKIEDLEVGDEIVISCQSYFKYLRILRKPGFGTKFIESLSDGASVFAEILLFFVKLWPIALLVVGIIALIKMVLKQKWFA